MSIRLDSTPNSRDSTDGTTVIPHDVASLFEDDATLSTKVQVIFKSHLKRRKNSIISIKTEKLKKKQLFPGVVRFFDLFP